MHAIKSRARHIAWRNNEDNFWSFVPYANRLGITTSSGGPNRVDAEATPPSQSAQLGVLDSETCLADSGSQDQGILATRPSSPLGFDNTLQCNTTLGIASIVNDVVHRRRFFTKAQRQSPSPYDPRANSRSQSRKYKRFGKHIPIVTQLRAIFWTWSTILHVFIPTGFAVFYTQQSAQAVFSINFVAIISSTITIGFAADEINGRVGNLTGGLLNVAVSNVPQLISAALLIKNQQYEVMKQSLLGVILLNVLLVTGLSFLCGGLNRPQQHFNVHRGQTVAQFLLLAVLAIVLPTALAYLDNAPPSKVDKLSRGTAIIVMVSYVLYLLFTLHTHNDSFVEPSEKVGKQNILFKHQLNDGAALSALARSGASAAAVPGAGANLDLVMDAACLKEEEPEESRLSWTASITILIVSTALLAFNTEFATSSIQGLLQHSSVTEQFLGLVVIPLLNCDPLPIQSAIKDAMDLSITITLDRCIQMAMVVIPMVVFIGWGMGIEDVNLVFDQFVVLATFVAIIIVTYTVQWGHTNWLIGALFIKVWAIIALSSYFLNDVNDTM